MKRGYDDLQATIEALNAKLSRNKQLVKSLTEQFKNADFERMNEIYSELTAELNQCGAEINEKED